MAMVLNGSVPDDLIGSLLLLEKTESAIEDEEKQPQWEEKLKKM